MKEKTADLWEEPADYRIITTNGTITKDGYAVMGRGVAYQAKQRYPGLERLLGSLLQEHGNHVMRIQQYKLITFPVKHHWWDRADLNLIARSVRELRDMIDPGVRYVMVRPGCGNGRLTWGQVHPLMWPLYDNVIIVHKE